MKRLTRSYPTIAGMILTGALMTGATLSSSALAATQASKLVAPQGAARDNFGYSVLLSQGDLFVGAQRRSGDNGALYAYFGDLAGESAPVEFLPPSGTRNFYGTSVVRQGDTLIIGAQRSAEAASQGGAAYVYAKDEAGAWNLVQTLTASDAATGDHFAHSMAISGDTLWVGAPRKAVSAKRDAGAVYVFTRQEDGQWVQKASFTSEAPEVDDQFGFTVAVWDGHALVGAPGVDSGGLVNSGLVRSFALGEEGKWVEGPEILPPQLSVRAAFGTSVAMHAQGALIGAPVDGVASPEGAAGAVYSMNLQEGAWSHVQVLTPQDNPTQGLQFGFRVSASPSGEHLVVGAPGALTPGFNAGMVYTFSKTEEGAWGAASSFQPEDVAGRDLVGSAVSIADDGTFALGVRGDDDQGSMSGSAYVFVPEEELVPAPVAPLGILLFGAAGLWGLGRRNR